MGLSSPFSWSLLPGLWGALPRKGASCEAGARPQGRQEGSELVWLWQIKCSVLVAVLCSLLRFSGGFS